MTPDPSEWTAYVDSPEGLVYYTEDPSDGSPRFTFQNDGSSAERDIFIQYDDLNDAKAGFLGYPTIVTAGGQNFISRAIPDYLLNVVNSDGDPYLFATTMSAKGWGTNDDVEEVGQHNPDTDTPYYEIAKLVVNYETLTYDIVSDQDMIDNGAVDTYGNPDEALLVRYVTFRPAPGAEYLTLPNSGYYYVTGTAGGVPITGGPGKIQCSYDFSITWHSIPKLAVPSLTLNPNGTGAIDLCLGCVNDATFADQKTASLLLTGALLTPVRSAAGDRTYDIEYHFKFISATNPSGTVVGNQGVYFQGQAAAGSQSAIAAGYYEVSTSGTSNLTAQAKDVNIYNYGDFNSLFRLYIADGEDDEGGE
jgi:hypothetical protein